jgi:hypothetical protein
VQVLLDAIASVATPLRISYLWRPMLPDPDDDLVLETAVNGHADAVITFNRRHFEPAAGRFGIEILASSEAVAVNPLINVAVAEKVSALRTEEYFAERAARGDVKKALQVLKRAGKGNPPLPGDELPAKTPRRRR